MHWVWLRIALALSACLAPEAALSQETKAPGRSQVRVLSVYSLPVDGPFYRLSAQVHRQALNAAFGDQWEYYPEFLDGEFHLRRPSYEAAFEDYLVHKYGDRGIDLLLANGPLAAAFVGRLQARLASTPPVVFHDFVVHGSGEGRPVPKSTGHAFKFPMKETLDLALRVHPDTRHVFLVCGTSPAETYYDDEFRWQVPTPPPGVEFTYLRGLSLPALTARMAALPPQSIVLLIAQSTDNEGRRFLHGSLVELLVAASNAPIYTWNGNFVGVGAFGGRLLSTERIAETTMQLAMRVLRGERPEDIPVTFGDMSVDALDWRQLARWHVSESSLPPAVELRFRELGVFQQYRGYILTALGVLVVQAMLIAGLLIQQRNRRLAENSLRESEERFRVMADTAPVMIWRAGPDQGCDFLNKQWLEFRGRRLEDELGDGWTEGVHPDDLERCLTVYRGAWPGREPFQMEYRLRRADGQYRWVFDTGVPRLGPDGGLLGYIGSCLDITERRRAEEALRANEAALRQSHVEIQDLAGRLITAQEQERARIARDLHDDFGQQLAAISIAISGCKREPELRANDELLGVLTAAQHQTIALAEDLRLLSHELHPGALKHAGLVDAVRSHCGEFARQHALDVKVEADEDIAGIDSETTLCLYRIVQETLRNIAKHAGARQARVTVRRVDHEVRLTVADDGRGFDLAKAHEQGGGLGLRNIDERVRLIGGRLSIESSPSMGTTITVWVKAVAPTVRELAEM